MALEDWDWTHSVKSVVPADANGIASATVSIYAWDVDTEEGEIDIIYANGVELGTLKGMAPGEERTWTTTVFNLPPSVVQELWQSGDVTIFMDIDHDLVGDRVNIGSSTLTVNYSTSGGGGGGGGTQPDVAVYRFWSPSLSSHFYTISEQERDGLVRDFGYVWTYEGVAFYAYPEGQQPAGALPVYRFWSGSGNRHFYTISEQERQTLVDQFSYYWTLEGVAWYAYE